MGFGRKIGLRSAWMEGSDHESGPLLGELLRDEHRCFTPLFVVHRLRTGV